MKDRAPLKRQKKKKNDHYLMLIKLANSAIEDLQDFKPNLMLLNEIIYVTATVINPVIITHEQNSFKQSK